MSGDADSALRAIAAAVADRERGDAKIFRRALLDRLAVIIARATSAMVNRRRTQHSLGLQGGRLLEQLPGSKKQSETLELCTWCRMGCLAEMAAGGISGLLQHPSLLHLALVHLPHGHFVIEEIKGLVHDMIGKM